MLRRRYSRVLPPTTADRLLTILQNNGDWMRRRDLARAYNGRAKLEAYCTQALDRLAALDRIEVRQEVGKNGHLMFLYRYKACEPQRAPLHIPVPIDGTSVFKGSSVRKYQPVPLAVIMEQLLAILQAHSDWMTRRDIGRHYDGSALLSTRVATALKELERAGQVEVKRQPRPTAGAKYLLYRYRPPTS